ncbi:MAG: PIN domain-containing protein [Candidatus Altarchaeum sp.]|nr:PIN domain-containing protein [Candidatus Altarchaeum sp.]
MLLVSKDKYMKKLKFTEEVMKEIDMDDSIFIATSLAQKYSLWSDDKHFDSQNNVNIYNTKDIVKLIKLQNRKFKTANFLINLN